MIIVMVECETCGTDFGIRPQDVRDRRSVHCIHCGKLVVMPTEDGRSSPVELAVDEQGNTIWQRSYIFARLSAPGETIVSDCDWYEVISSNIDRRVEPPAIRTVLRRLPQGQVSRRDRAFVG